MSKFVISRFRQHAWLACILLLVGFAERASAQNSTGLISQEQAASVGLKRAWFARAQIDPTRSSVVNWILSADQLLLVTDAGIMHAIDANTGKTNWVTQFGKPEYPSLGPAANGEYIAVINGSTLYLLDSETGRIQGERRIGGAPGAGPAVGKDHVYTSTIDGLVEGYPMDLSAPQYKRWFYQSFGHTLVAPLVTPESVAWTTDRGNLYVSGAVQPGVRFRLETSGKFDARPAYRAPLIYAIALSGEMFAVHELNGTLAWRYMTGYPTDRSPAAVGEQLFVTSEEPMLHCVNASTGLLQWKSLGISQFAAVSKSHVFGVDRYGTVHILSSSDGAPIGRIPTGGVLNALVNDQTDRLYLISDRGLVQCLHEIGADKPTYYARPLVVKEEPADAEADVETPSDDRATTEPTPRAVAPVDESEFDDDSASPFGESVDAAPADDSGFGTDDENPFD